MLAFLPACGFRFLVRGIAALNPRLMAGAPAGVLPALLAAAILAAPLAAAEQPPLFLPRPATVRRDRFQVMFGQGRQGAVGYVCCHGVFLTAQELVRDEANGDPDAERGIHVQIQATGTVDQFIFGQQLTETAVRDGMQAIGKDLVLSIDKVCGLTPEQRARLELATVGEAQRFFDRAQAVKSKFEEYESLASMDQFREWAAELERRVAALHATNLFCDGSLFDKVLRGVLAPQQIAELAARPLNPIPLDNQLFTHLRTVALREQQAKQAADEVLLKDPARLEAVLINWTQASSGINHLDCEFRRFRYDPTFEVEKRAIGSLAVSRDGRAAYKVAPAVIPPGLPGRKVAKNGQLFQVQPDSADVWYWTGKSILHVHEKERTFEEITLPKDDEEQHAADLAADANEAPAAGVRPADGPPGIDRKKREFFTILLELRLPSEFLLARPFLLGMPVPELQQRYEIKLLRQNATEIWLNFRPRRKKDEEQFREATLILATQGYLPKALKLIDSSGSETVHTFTNLRLSRKDAALLPDPPDLTGYRRLLDQRAQSPR